VTAGTRAAHLRLLALPGLAYNEPYYVKEERMAREKLALVDGHAVAFRAFHAMREADLRAASGEPTFAVFGFLQIVLTTLQQLRPQYAAVAFDVGRTFRDDLYAEYKANRTEAPEDFHTQLARIKQVVEALNIPIYAVENYEADDVIGTLSRQASKQNVETYIITGDSDTLQLVDEHVRVLLAVPYGKRQEAKEYDLAAVIERYKGLRPDQLADLRGLKGDTSDNIPGVKGIGETGAIALLNQFQTVEGIYERLDEVPNRYRKALDGQQEQALFSKRLATIHCDVPVELSLEQCRLSGYDRNAVIALFQELQFGSLLRKLPETDGSAAPVAAEPPPENKSTRRGKADSGQMALFDDQPAPAAVELSPAPPAHGEYLAVRTQAELDELLRQLRAAPIFAFDTETDSLNVIRSQVVGLSFATQPGQAWYVPIGHSGDDAEPQLARELVRDALLPLLEDARKPKVAHNAKFDLLALRPRA
jgi:DNA polymerase I